MYLFCMVLWVTGIAALVNEQEVITYFGLYLMGAAFLIPLIRIGEKRG